MTALLWQALRRVESLSSEEQDAIASQIIETLDDEAAWARSFRENPTPLRSLANKALRASPRRDASTRRTDRMKSFTSRHNPSHPGLPFKKVENEDNVYSARVGIGYRALARMDGEDVVWFWIGPHAEYDKSLRG